MSRFKDAYNMVTNKLSWNRVVMTAIFDMVVRPDFDSLGFGIEVSLLRLRLQCRFIEFVEQRFTTCTILFHLMLV